MHQLIRSLTFLCALSLSAADLKLGIIGTDVSHVIHFSRILNTPGEADHVAGARIVAAYKGGSPDIVSSRTRVDKFAEDLAATYGVEIVPDIPTLCARSTVCYLKAVMGAFTYSRPSR